jgi:hypothetical protein
VKQSIKRFIFIYISIGMVWALITRFPFGVMLDDYKGEHEYWNRITAVKDSHITESGNLVLCLQGRLAYSQAYPTDITKFSLTIPIKKIISNGAYKNEFIKVDQENNVIVLSDKLIIKDCKSEPNVFTVKITKARYTPEQAYDFNSVSMLKNLKPDNNKEYMIYVVPTANSTPSSETDYLEKVRVFFIMKNLDSVGRSNYVISIKPTIIDRKIGLGERAIAFVKDTFFYPIAIIMMGGWGH